MRVRRIGERRALLAHRRAVAPRRGVVRRKAEVVAAVCAAVDIPVIPKLTPNVDDIAVIGRAALEAGASALCAINTAGPGYTESHGHPVLSNRMGGMSGKGVLPTTLKALKALRAETDVPLIGCGGLSCAADCRAAIHCGATILGIGSGLTGMNTEEVQHYFADLARQARTQEGPKTSQDRSQRSQEQPRTDH